MRKLFITIFCLSYGFCALAQHETLGNLEYNPGLYYSTQKYQQPQVPNGLLSEKGKYIIFSDTLGLPFVDDFSTNRLRSYKALENNVFATYQNVYGTCLGRQGISTVEGYFVRDSAYQYFYNAATQQLDSVGIPPMKFHFFGPSLNDCFNDIPQEMYYSLPYYRPVSVDTNGNFIDVRRVDSLPTPVRMDTLQYAPVVYFSRTEPGTLWTDNYAYVNNTYPVNPPTIGVATFDGLNEYGLPYNNISISTYGTADYLTSKPINLSGLTLADSVYLSFFYEGQGLGDYPDKRDSLIVEFRSNNDIWYKVWSDTGFSDIAFVRNEFKRVLVPIGPLAFAGETFLHNTFQFRFRNMASLYGNNDHWHIDYVVLDRNRNQADTNILDIAFVYDFPTILKDYTLLPADQFAGNADLKDEIVLPVHNLDKDADQFAPATNFATAAVELYPIPSAVASSPVQTFNAAKFSDITVLPATEYTIVPNHPAWPVDSLVIVATAAISPNDIRASNDTITHVQQFSNIMAYDDGSAERAYGLSGLGTKKFAYEFDLPRPDTLAGFQVMFAQVEGNVRDLIFNFYAWDSLQLDSFRFVDAPIWEMTNKKPLYVDSVNGFTTYVLDTPILISGKFYLGWAQTDTRSLQIGYDLNSTLGRRHMYLYTNGTWKRSSVSPDGSPMIRLILDGDYQGKSTTGIPQAVADISRLQMFPNPTTGTVNLRSDAGNALFDISIMNMMGQLVQQERAVSTSFSIGNLPNGIYLLAATDVSSGKVYQHKLIKTAW